MLSKVLGSGIQVLLTIADNLTAATTTETCDFVADRTSLRSHRQGLTILTRRTSLRLSHVGEEPSSKLGGIHGEGGQLIGENKS
jgi:hypothetical protein